MVEQLVDVLSLYDLQVPEQVIDVPKIILENIPSRRLCREPQLAEHLVEVPTVLYFLKQKVDNPVPRRGGAGSLQGFIPGHSSAPVEQTVDIPAPRSGVRRLQGFLTEQSATAFGEADDRFQQRLSSRSLTILLPVEAFKIYAQDRVLRHPLTHQLILRMTHFKGFFRIFLRVGTASALEPWTPTAYDVPMALEEEEEDEESEDEPDFDVEYVEFDGCWWGCEWVPTRQQYCWWLAVSDG